MFCDIRWHKEVMTQKRPVGESVLTFPLFFLCIVYGWCGQSLDNFFVFTPSWAFVLACHHELIILSDGKMFRLYKGFKPGLIWSIFWTIFIVSHSISCSIVEADCLWWSGIPGHCTPAQKHSSKCLIKAHNCWKHIFNLTRVYSAIFIFLSESFQ